MGFSIFGFLSRLLGFLIPKGKKTLQITATEALERIRKKASKQRGEAEKALASKSVEIKHTLNGIKKVLDEVQSYEIPEDNPKLAKVVETSKQQVFRQVSSIAEKLSVPEPATANSIRDYYVSAYTVLHSEGFSLGRNVTYTSILLKEKIKKIGSYFKEIDETLSEIKKYLDENKAVFAVADAERTVEQINEQKAKLAGLTEKKNGTALELQYIIGKKENLEEELNSMKSSSDIDEYEGIKERKSALYKEKQNIKTRIVDLLSGVDKPFKRFQKLVEIGEIAIPKPLEETINEYLLNPFAALKKDQKAEHFKEILRELKKAVESDKIQLKEFKEKEKKLAAIDELLAFDFFENVFWALNKLESEIIAIEKEESKSEIHSKIGSKFKEISEIGQEIQDKGFLLKKLKEEIEAEEEKNIALKHKFEDMAKETLGFDINIPD